MRILIGGGSLIDGTGAPARPADVLIDQDRVAAVLPPGTPAGAAERVDARGLIVCPGFIDIHSHGDLVLALPPAEQRRLLEGRLSQGITTEIVGNCGLGVFPRDDTSELALRGILGWMTPGGEAGASLEQAWPWTDLASYLERLEAGGTWINVGALQPHGPLRIQAAGLTPSPDGEAAARAARGMARRLAASLDAGAFGLSVGLIYPPGIFTPTEEIVDLACVVADRCGDRAFVASHIRGSSETLLPAVDELLRIGRETGARVQHSHSEAVGPGHWSKIPRVLAMEEAAARAGVGVAFDMFPYTAAATMMMAIYPPWALEGGVGRLLERLADPSQRAAIGRSIESFVPEWPPWTPGGWPHNLVGAVGWDAIVVGSVGTGRGAADGANRTFEGMSLAELGRVRGTTPFDAICDLMIEEEGLVSQIIHGVSGDDAHEEGIETLLAHPSGCVCTDANDFGKGRPHPAAWGTFPRVLGRYVRERRTLTLEDAVHRMTGRPAALLGLADRGVIGPGAFADLVMFDPETVGSDASFDRPRVAARGIRGVLVNGVVVAGAPGAVAVDAGSRPPGRVLRRR